MKRIVLAVATLAMLAAGCSTASASKTPSHTSAAVSASTDVVSVTGFGATEAAWNASHHAADGVHAAVHIADGRVLGYVLNLANQTSLANAIDAVRRELPSDAKVVSQVQGVGTCVEIDMRSVTLAPLLADPKIGDPTGDVDVVLSNTAGSASPAGFDTASLGVGGSASLTPSPC